MKRKVQAQRKFAQGAYVPPSPAPPVPVERRPDVSNGRADSKNVFHNSMNASSLLDIVAMQNLHAHVHPVVLIERMDGIQEEPPREETEQRPAAPTFLAASLFRASPQTRVSRSRQRPRQRPCSRSRRSASQSSVWSDDQPLTVIAQSLQRPSPSPQRTPALPPTPPASSPRRQTPPLGPPHRTRSLLTPLPECLQPEKPKIIQKRKGSVKTAPRSLSSQSAAEKRGRRSLPSPSPKAVAVPTPAKALPPPPLRQDPVVTEDKRTQVVLRSNRHKRELWTPDPHGKKYYPRTSPCPSRTSRSTESVAHSLSPAWTPKKRNPKSTPKRPKNFTLKRGRPAGKCRAPPARSPGKKQKTIGGVAAVGGQDPSRLASPQIGANPRNDVMEWLMDCPTPTPQDNNETDQSNFKVPRVPARRKETTKCPEKAPENIPRPPSVAFSEPSSTVSSTCDKVQVVCDYFDVASDNLEALAAACAVKFAEDRPLPRPHTILPELELNVNDPVNCSSRLLNTVPAIVRATVSDLKKRCYVCRYCHRVDRILRLSLLLRTSRFRHPFVDVYDFSFETDEEPQPLNYKQNRRLRSGIPWTSATSPAATKPIMTAEEYSRALAQVLHQEQSSLSKPNPSTSTGKPTVQTGSPNVIVLSNTLLPYGTNAPQMRPEVSPALNSNAEIGHLGEPCSLSSSPGSLAHSTVTPGLAGAVSPNAAQSNNLSPETMQMASNLVPGAAQMAPNLADETAQAALVAPFSYTPASLDEYLKSLKTPIYLDLFGPEYPRLIEISAIATEKDPSKSILHARLVLRDSTTVRTEFSLAAHGHLLDELLSTLTRELDNQNAEKLVESRKSALGKVRKTVLDKVQSDQNVISNVDDDDEEAAPVGSEESGEETDESDSPSTRGGTEGSRHVAADDTRSKAKAPASKRVTGLTAAPSNIYKEAPSFYPTEEEFMDPISYFEKIYDSAKEFGVCKVVAPASFRPSCFLPEDVRFNVSNQYVARMFNRWGPATQEMCAIRAYLADQKVFFTRPPLFDGIELNLPKLYRTVLMYGGLQKIIERKRWSRVAEEMRLSRSARSLNRIDLHYVKHLLPYETLSSDERAELKMKVETAWKRNYNQMIARATNPLHRQRRMMGDTDSGDEAEAEIDDDPNLAAAITQTEDCIIPGRNMKLTVFQKVADNEMNLLFGKNAHPEVEEVEVNFWETVGTAFDHICVYSASLDTGEGYGFSTNKVDPNSKHDWNLKNLSQNSKNALRSLGPVVGVTVPTLHLGMVFSTSCWHRDPHRMPWVEYMHKGPAKIWYAMPDEQGESFRQSIEAICPTSAQNKSMWLPSDITMIPPAMLEMSKITLSRIVQRPGEFIIVFPKAYSSSISTGYTESESAYFATESWLDEVEDVFKELRENCEPSMFSMEQLLLGIAADASAPHSMLRRVQPALCSAVRAELAHRSELRRRRLAFTRCEEIPSPPKATGKKRPAWNVRDQLECDICRSTLFLSKVTGLLDKDSNFCLEHALKLMDKRGPTEPPGWLDNVRVTELVAVIDLTRAVQHLATRLQDQAD